MTTSVDGLVSGLSSSDTISQLMAVERQSQTRLTSKKSSVESIISSFQTLNSKMLGVKDVSASLKADPAWQLTQASSSDISIATVTAAGTAIAGSLSFRVDQLASTETLVSAGTVSSTSAIVATPGSHYLVSAASGLGFSLLTGSNDLTLGAHTVVVTQASAGASQTGTALGSSITIGGGATLGGDELLA